MYYYREKMHGFSTLHVPYSNALHRIVNRILLCFFIYNGKDYITKVMLLKILIELNNL